MPSNGEYTVRDHDGDIASMADWYDAKDLNISGEAGDVTVATKYSGLVLKGLHNHGAAAGTMLCTSSRGSSFSVTLPSGGFSGKLPQIATLTQSGSSDDFTLFFQKK